jgi:nucleotide-binding universal stress UspA family protein
MKTIIVPTDFSPAALNAANYAADMAHRINAGLSLLYVCLLPQPVSEIPVPASDMEGLIQDAEAELLKLKQHLQQRVGASLAITIEVTVGTFVPALIEYCADIKPYAVVMGANGKGAVEQFLFGSNTVHAVMRLGWPLLVIPPNASFTNIQKVGLACDFRHVSESVPVQELKDLVTQFGAQLHVLHVNDTGDYQGLDNTDMENVKKEGPTLREMLDDLHPCYHFMSREGVEEGIAGFARKSGLDLLVVIPHKHSLLGTLFHKSHTKQLVLNAPVPILSIHE